MTLLLLQVAHRLEPMWLFLVVISLTVQLPLLVVSLLQVVMDQLVGVLTFTVVKVRLVPVVMFLFVPVMVEKFH